MARSGHSMEEGFTRHCGYGLDRGPERCDDPRGCNWSPGCGMSKRRTRRSRRTVPIYLAPEVMLVLIRSRSIRFAAVALAATIPMVASYAGSAFAAGDDADVHADVTASNVHVTSTKGLSRVTVVLCNGDV